MSTVIDYSTQDFPKRLPEKLKTIREHLNLSPDEIAPKVGARTGAEILAYEADEDDLLVTVLWAYAKLAGCPIDNLLYDHLEVTFRGLRTV
jgi:transcriptional regulator with XRE-family HTH domain